jgi:glycerophosphoryl diester phosphodiesterase
MGAYLTAAAALPASRSLAQEAGGASVPPVAKTKPDGALQSAQRQRPLVLGHRGSSAHRPEHTLASYAKAIADGADFIEPDLVSSKDGVLIARHENNIAETTDVSSHSEFAARKTAKVIDGQRQTGWFTEDFTFAELKRLRAKERLGALRPESQSYDGQFQIVSLAEIADFVGAEAAARGRTIGLIPELKHSTYFASIGLRLEPVFLQQVAESHQLQTAPLIIQSFEVANLKFLRQKLSGYANVQLMQLVGEPDDIAADIAAAGGKTSWRDMVTPTGLKAIAAYADYLAPNTRAIIAMKADGHLGEPTGLVEAAHRAGLKVGTWTFRPENAFLAADFRNGAGDAARNPEGSVAEIRRFLATGIDAFFTDDPYLGRLAVDSI